MADNVVTLLLYLRLANIVVSAYLFKVLFSAVFARHNGSFSRITKIMLVAVLLFFLIEVVQIFRVIGGVEFELIQSAFAFSFLLLLLAATLEIQRGMRAHDHLVRRKLRGKLSDVE